MGEASEHPVRLVAAPEPDEGGPAMRLDPVFWDHLPEGGSRGPIDTSTTKDLGETAIVLARLACSPGAAQPGGTAREDSRILQTVTCFL